MKIQEALKVQTGNWWARRKALDGRFRVAVQALVEVSGRATAFGVVVSLCLLVGCLKGGVLYPYRFVPTTDVSETITVPVNARAHEEEIKVKCPFFHLTAKGGSWVRRSIELHLYVENVGNSVVEVDLPQARLSVLDDPLFSKPVVTGVTAVVPTPAGLKGEGYRSDVVIVEPGKAVDMWVQFYEDVTDLVYLDLQVKAGEPSESYGLQFQYKANGGLVSY